MASSGTLTIVVQNARFSSDKDFLGKMDPYVVVRIGQNEFRTVAANGMGSTPVWNQSFTCYVTGEPNQQVMTLEVYDKDKISRDDFLGSATLSLAQVYQNRTAMQSVLLHNKAGREAGELNLQLTFAPQGGSQPYRPGYPAPQPGYQQTSYQQSAYSHPGMAQSYTQTSYSPNTSFVGAGAGVPYTVPVTYSTGVPATYTSSIPATFSTGMPATYATGSYTTGMPSAFPTAMPATYTSSLPSAFPTAAPAASSVTPIPGGYTQTVNFPGGFAQTSYAQSYTPPTTTTSYGPNSQTTTTYSGSESVYQQSSRSAYHR